MYLDPSSPLLPTLSLPRGSSITDMPLVTSHRVGLLLDKEELEALHTEQYTVSSTTGTGAGMGELLPLFSEEVFWSLLPSSYMCELLLVPTPLRYGMLVVRTGGHWTTTLFSGLADAVLPTNRIENVIAFFGCVMEVWAVHVQWMLDEHHEAERWKSWWVRDDTMEKRIVIRPYQWNWYNWSNIREMNRMFDVNTAQWSPERYVLIRKKSSVLASLRFPDIHFFSIDRPALLRSDAHVASDCLHIMTGAGVLEVWTHYIWQLVSRELPGRI
ncbi:hypothetical protein WOLCODRAFT_156587 [Wolfiporia cocos MD-104 SS10]|uniref:Uncharacterized protein n=1 Tax=Wolfiporia cocos (strain MD-104) TaxID=742152 RepID=A0A2H3JAW4_WOLCO|nr:hypothetical protein WOLCODRAFT_156587 [Wolfiporia cocos MD-104 SS10]